MIHAVRPYDWILHFKNHVVFDKPNVTIHAIQSCITRAKTETNFMLERSLWEGTRVGEWKAGRAAIHLERRRR